mgnify:FL=1
MEWSIQEIARLAGTTSRTLRHYDAAGLLPPTRIARNGYRHYDQAALVRLQRILLLRELGLGLPAIADVLAHETTAAHALEGHREWLRMEQDRLARQIASVTRTIGALNEGEGLMAEQMFDGFDHTAYQGEVENRWGAATYAKGDAWWMSMNAEEKAAWQQRVSELGRDWIAAAEAGLDPSGPDAQALAERHVAWLRSIPGTPAASGGDIGAYVAGLAEMYVADPRFAANYATAEGGTRGAEFVRDALQEWVRAWSETRDDGQQSAR